MKAKEGGEDDEEGEGAQAFKKPVRLLGNEIKIKIAVCFIYSFIFTIKLFKKIKILFN